MPGFHMIVRIVLIAPVVSENFETIRTTGTIDGFDKIVSIASKTRDAESSAMFLGMTTEVLHVRPKQAKHIWRILIRERSSWLAVCLFSRFCGVTRWKCSLKTQRQLASGPELDGRDYLFFRYCPYAVRTFL